MLPVPPHAHPDLGHVLPDGLFVQLVLVLVDQVLGQEELLHAPGLGKVAVHGRALLGRGVEGDEAGLPEKVAVGGDSSSALPSGRALTCTFFVVYAKSFIN